MAANENTKFQINYKLADGTLINIYATSATELEAGLADIAMNAANIHTTGQELNGKLAQSAAPARAVADIQAQFNAPAAEAPGSKSCKHGPMAFKSGTSAKGPWQGYMCNSPKGSPDKCETIWVR